MARISNKIIYPINNQISINDYIIGTRNGDKRTLNFNVSGLLNLFTESVEDIIRDIEDTIYKEGNELIDGGFSHVANFDWYVYAQKYRFNGVVTNNLVYDTLTLSPAPTGVDEKRFDVIVFNDNFTFSVIEGAVGTDPAIPIIDPKTQIKVTTILIEANTTEPSYISEELVFNENLGLPTEFTATEEGDSIDLEYTGDSSDGTKSIRILNPVNSDILILDKGETFDFGTVDTISLRIKNLVAGTQTLSLYTYNSIEGFYQGTTVIRDGRYGYDSNNTIDWQTILVPRSNIIPAGVENTGIAIAMFNSESADILIDEVKFLKGATDPITAPTVGAEYTLSPLVDGKFMLLKDGAPVSEIQLATVAQTGSYNDLGDKPYIPTKTSDLVNDGEDGINPFISQDDVILPVSELLDVSATLISDLTFDVIANKFPVNNAWYSATRANVTLDAADATFDRIDLIVANIDGTVDKITGEASATPSEPNYDASIYYPIKFVLVPAGAVDLTVNFTDTTLFDEGVNEPAEWTYELVTAPETTLSTNDFYTGSNSIEHTALPNSISGFVRLTSATKISADKINTIKFAVKLKEQLNSDIGFILRANGSTVKPYYIRHGQYGFNKVNLNWQVITIPVHQAGLSSIEIDEIVFHIAKNNFDGFFVDAIIAQVESAVINPPTEITHPTHTSAFINDGDGTGSRFVEDDELNPVAKSGDYNDLSNKPTIVAVHKIYADWATCVADQANQLSQNLYRVDDASGHPTVDSGYAYFEYLGTTVGDDTDYRKLSEEESMDLLPPIMSVQDETATEQFTVDTRTEAIQFEGFTFDAPNKRVTVVVPPSSPLVEPADIRVIPNYALPSTSQDVIIEAKNINDNTIVSFGAGVTLNSQKVELNKFGALVVRANVTHDATEGSIDVTINNGITKVFSGAYTCVNGTPYKPIESDWIDVAGQINISGGDDLVSTSFQQSGSAVWNREFDYTKSWVLKWKVKASPLGDLNWNRPAYEILSLRAVSDNTKFMRIDCQIYIDNYINFPFITPLDNDAWNNLTPTGNWDANLAATEATTFQIKYDAATQKMAVYFDTVNRFASNFIVTENVKVFFNTIRLDFYDITYIDLSTAGTPEAYDDNYATKSDLEGLNSSITTLNNTLSGGLLPQVFLSELIPDSYLPNTTGNFRLIGAYFTETMVENENLNSTNGILIEGQTINYATFVSDNEILVNVTTGSAEGKFDVTLNNGSGAKVFNDFVLIVLGDVYKPTSLDWENIIQTPNILTEGEMILVNPSVTSSATWTKAIDTSKHFRIQFSIKESPLVLKSSVAQTFITYFSMTDDVTGDNYQIRVWLEANFDRSKFYIYKNNVAIGAHRYTVSGNFIFEYDGANIYLNTNLSDEYQMNLIENVVLSNTWKCRFYVKHYDIKNIKYIELAS